ncbi:lysophosphatidylcholine acyltransferase 2 [Amblyraja radiata]|uniref:lysophosphatidylcholine acyltransferase 2 n=1 Tax=Amblyraja radiata TaxID=386614 RepID=UPI001402E085|nr:lysophosphatidylcholine acyltransferase 2 [Amblyraja radiata]
MSSLWPLRDGRWRRVFPRQSSLYQPTVLNPFIYHVRLGFTDKLRIVLASITLLPLRVVCIIVLAIFAWPCSLFGRLCHYTYGNREPFPSWKRRVSQVMLKVVGRAFYFCVGFIQIKVKGKRAEATEAPILVVAPHSTFFDAIVNIVADIPSIVSRAENADVPLIGSFLHCVQPILVSRNETDSRKNTIEEITKRATSKGKWPQLMIFPEGTCTNRACLITFKSGAFIPGVPVQPVLIRYPNRLDTVTWTWQGHSASMLTFLTLCQPYTNVEIEFLPVYVPNAEERSDPFLYANRVRSTMATELDVPMTDHTFEDCRLMISAGELTLPMEAGLVEFTKISRKLNLKWDNVRKQLDCFATIASKSKGGRIGIEEFAEHLKLPISPPLREVFALFDRNGDGTIDFREYVIGLVILCSPANTEETVQFAFKMFDIDEDGYITEDEFSSLLRSAFSLHDLDVSQLFKTIDVNGDGKISYEIFREFALTHPEYAKLFTTYLDLQRYKAWQSITDDEMDLEKPHKVAPSICEDSCESSDKKED